VRRIKLLRSGQGVFLILALLTREGCSASTSPNDVYAGVYDAVIWTRSVRGSEPYNNLGVEGASYTLSLQSDGRAQQHLYVPGGSDGGLYDQAFPGTWTARPPDSLIVALSIVTLEGDTVPAFILPFSVQGDTLRTTSEGTQDTHEVVVLVRRRVKSWPRSAA